MDGVDISNTNLTLNQNAIYDNGRHDLVVSTGPNSAVIDVRSNWWGTSNIGEINSNIIDGVDDFALAFADYGGLLSAGNGDPIAFNLVISDIASDTTWVTGDQYYLV